MQRVQYRQEYGCPGTGSGTGGVRGGRASSGLTLLFLSPVRSVLEGVVDSRSAGHRAPEMAQESR